MRLIGGGGCKHSPRDPRALKFASLFERKALPSIPNEYDFDKAFPGVSTPMFANDVAGDCVIAGRAHLTRRFERVEQGIVLPISDAEVLAEWHRQNGNTDDGLYPSASYKQWRKGGWKLDGNVYRIDCYADVDPCETSHVQASIYLLHGIGGGFDLPRSVCQNTGPVPLWDLTGTDLDAPEPNAGHFMVSIGYNRTGPILLTWGRRQQCTWRWWEAYCAQAIAAVDSLDPWTGQIGIDVPAARDYLKQISS